MLHGFDDASCGPEVVKPRVHEDPVDGVHQLANLHLLRIDDASPRRPIRPLLVITARYQLRLAPSLSTRSRIYTSAKWPIQNRTR